VSGRIRASRWLSEPGAYVLWVSYLKYGSWHWLTPEKDFTVSRAITPTHPKTKKGKTKKGRGAYRPKAQEYGFPPNSSRACAKALGLNVTAEGIENDEQRARLTKLGCELGQGYHFAKPLPSDEVAEFLYASPERTL
jgi:hypothetical protein